MSYLVDGESYFRTFRDTARNARHSILILGWDIDSRFELVRGGVDDGLPTALRAFLDALAERREGLEIHVLNWDYSLILAPDREWATRIRLGWNTHPRVHFRLDDRLPVGASHHQKVAVVDDRVAFVGGLDFTRGRWDTSEHRPDDPRRADGEGEVPQPYHDLQMMVSGPVAADLGDLARERWREATGDTPARPPGDARLDPWPAGCEADLHDVPVAVARTLPAYGRRAEVREVERLLVDGIGRARDRIFIENQYFTAPCIGEALARRLDEEDGPEVVLLLPRETVGWLSQNTMDVLRERRIRQLRDADRHGRFRVFYPHQPGLSGTCINLHSKVMVVDERLLCVGSANLNNRSLGLDSECNLAIEAGESADRREGIAQLRDRLLAEHLDVKPAEVAEAIGREGSLIAAIEKLQGPGRTLRPLELRVAPEVDASVPATAIADPEQPIDADYLARQLVPEEDQEPAWLGLLGLAALLVLALLLAAAWRWTPLGEWVDAGAVLDAMTALRGDWLAPLLVLLIYVVGGLVMVPVTLMIVATGLAFGAVYGFGYALLGAEISALVSYGIGHRLGHGSVSNLSGRWVARASRFLGRQGLLAMITLRVVPVAPFTVVNLVAGASHIRFRDFALGTLLGMIPGTLALVVLSDQVVAALRSPDAAHIALLVGLAALIGLGTWGIRRSFGNRQ